MALIRKAGKEDLDHMTSIWNELMSMHENFDNVYRLSKDWPEQFKKHLLKWCNEPDKQIYVAEVDGRLAGFIIAWVATRPSVFMIQKMGYINDMVISEQYRGQGIGEKLVKEVLTYFKQENIEMIQLIAAVKNEAGVKFWKKMGFNPVNYQMVQYI